MQTWALAAAMVVVDLAPVEGFWRSRGFVPWVFADQDLWAQQRAAATRGGRRAIAVLGTSRIHSGLSTEVLRREFPGHAIAMLAVPATLPVATLEDLAHDEGFTGVVLCDIRPFSILSGALESQAEYVRHYRSAWNLQRDVERTLLSMLQRRLVLVQWTHRLDPRKLWWILRSPGSQELPSPEFGRWLDDGSVLLDYTKADLERIVRSRREGDRHHEEDVGPISAGQWREGLDRLERSIRRIQSRGGRVVLIDYPSSDDHRILMDRLYPRERSWDVLARETEAETIHFEDVPALADFHCPDGLHLDYRDATRFTKALAAELRRRGILPRSDAVEEHR